MEDGHDLKDARFDKSNPHIGTVTGRSMYLLTPKEEDVCLEDIAHSLSRIVRWNGHILDGNNGHPLTVAEHSLRVAARVARDLSQPWPEMELAALLHDAHEAYLGDIPTPVAYALGVHRVAALKLGLDTAIFGHFGLGRYLPYSWQVIIKKADKAEGDSEAVTRFRHRDCMSPRLAYEEFMNRVESLREAIACDDS